MWPKLTEFEVCVMAVPPPPLVTKTPGFVRNWSHLRVLYLWFVRLQNRFIGSKAISWIKAESKILCPK